MTVPLSNYMAGPSQPLPQSLQSDPNQMVQDSLQSMLNPNSMYIQNARQNGVNYAASRGGLNSSIAAGASEKSAIDSAMPLVQDSLDIQKQRQALQGQNWLDTQGFNRQFQGQLAMLPMASSYHMLDLLQQASLNDPSLWGPDQVSGMSNFFTNNMADIMGRYFNSGPGTQVDDTTPAVPLPPPGQTTGSP